MAVGYGVACPKPEPQKRVTARRKRQAAKVVKSVRAQVVDDASGRCEDCGVYVGAHFGHAHHRVPRSLGGTWTVENIKLVCPCCHARAHRLRVR